MRAFLSLLATLLLAAPAQPQQSPSPPPMVAVPVTLVTAHPHDRTAFTQGLLIHDGALYESTGREGASEVRRVDLRSGRVLARVKLPASDFGEGIGVAKGDLVSVTWHGGRGYRWSLPALKQRGTFRYAGEGWGMTTAATGEVVLSDGTPVLRFLDPVTLEVVRTVRVTANGRAVARLNELEWVDGEILANVWMQPFVARIDPATGIVRGFLDLSALVERVAATDTDAVPNGIAWDARQRKLYVTGKYWPEIFEIAWPVTATGT